MIDYYVILGITRDADESEIREAYERKAHKNTKDDVVNNQLLDEAYNILTDKQKRLIAKKCSQTTFIYKKVSYVLK